MAHVYYMFASSSIYYPEIHVIDLKVNAYFYYMFASSSIHYHESHVVDLKVRVTLDYFHEVDGKETKIKFRLSFLTIHIRIYGFFFDLNVYS